MPGARFWVVLACGAAALSLASLDGRLQPAAFAEAGSGKLGMGHDPASSAIHEIDEMRGEMREREERIGYNSNRRTMWNNKRMEPGVGAPERRPQSFDTHGIIPDTLREIPIPMVSPLEDRLRKFGPEAR